jgi:hypothetical protein
MNPRTFYIDPVDGDDSLDGLTSERAARSHESREVRPGDRVLFRRGRVMRAALSARSGVEGRPIVYGAYGNGEAPRFLGSVAADDPAWWVETRPSVWRYEEDFPSEVCNLVFDGGASCGNLRWSIDELTRPDEWYSPGIGTGRGGEDRHSSDQGETSLYLFSPENPALVHSSIECVLWGKRKLAEGREHVVIEDLSFRNSGVHGYQESHARDVVIRRCEFAFIGGAVWDRGHRVRFGNGVELWDGASDVTVEACRFDNIYDAGVTHQGGGTRNVPERIIFRDNLFLRCGLSAYECREPCREVFFERNICIDSGGGFAMQGEKPPRASEIYLRERGDDEVDLVLLESISGSREQSPRGIRPIEVGHHVFIWRIDEGTQDGLVSIRDNIFHEAPRGAAVYSIIRSADMRHFELDGNRYSESGEGLLAYLCGRSYGMNEIDLLREEWGYERHGIAYR